MLFDEKDLRVFDNADSRSYFMEILQSYYSQNYRATIVLLYSFVIYDLFIKLQTMANEGDRKAVSKLKEINRMTYDSLKKSYKTFLRLLFVSEDEKCIENVYGLYAFSYVMTGYIVKQGYTAIFSESIVQDALLKITVDSLEKSSPRKNALIKIIMDYPAVMDVIRDNTEVFEYLSNRVLSKPQSLKYYRTFYPRSDKTTYAYFKDNSSVQKAGSTEILYDAVKECSDFNLAEFSRIMVNAIPIYSGFDAADGFMNFFTGHLHEISIDDIKTVMKVYRQNGQCINRGRHTTDFAVVERYIREHSDETEANDSGIEQ